MFTGFACVPLFKFAVPLIPQWGPHLSKMEELAPSFLLAIGAGVLVTLVTSKRCELTPGIGIEGQALKKYNRLNRK